MLAVAMIFAVIPGTTVLAAHIVCPFSTPIQLEGRMTRDIVIHWSTVERRSSGSNFYARVQVNASSHSGSFFARAEMHSGGRMVTTDANRWVSGAHGRAVTATSTSPTTPLAGTARGFFGT